MPRFDSPEEMPWFQAQRGLKRERNYMHGRRVGAMSGRSMCTRRRDSREKELHVHAHRMHSHGHVHVLVQLLSVATEGEQVACACACASVVTELHVHALPVLNSRQHGQRLLTPAGQMLLPVLAAEDGSRSQVEAEVRSYRRMLTRWLTRITVAMLSDVPLSALACPRRGLTKPTGIIA